MTLYLTERCNSRCISCDYWRHGRADLSPQSVARLLPELRHLRTQAILISGGEPLIHPQWAEIAELLKSAGLRLWLLTSGLSLAKHAARAAALFDSITVSLDGPDRLSYAAIRGLDAFDKVYAGIRAVSELQARVGVRITVQRQNYSLLPALLEVARAAGATQVSFLGADVRNRGAFGRDDGFSTDIALSPEDLPAFAAVLDRLERDHKLDFDSGFIAESPHKLRRIWQYYAALCGRESFPPTRCNAPEFSAVLEATGRLNPCFFIQGPDAADASADLAAALGAADMLALRAEIRAGARSECTTCVCSMWRDLDRNDPIELVPERAARRARPAPPTLAAAK